MKPGVISDTQFIKHVVVASIIVLILSSYPVIVYASAIQIYSIICGFCIALINALAGNFLNTLALKKPGKSFMVIVFGSMGIRMMFIAIVLMIMIFFAKLDDFTLVGTVFFFYIIFVSIEIFHLHKKQLLLKKIKLNSEHKD
jgi:hypothetical protein